MKKYIFIILVLFCGCKKEALHNLTDNQSTAIITALDAANIKSDRKSEGKGLWKILVEEKDLSKTIEIAEFNKSKFFTDDKELSVSPLASPEERKDASEVKKAREIESTLRRLPNVHDVRVHIMYSNQNLFGESKTEGSGSVMLLINGESVISPDEVSKLVGGASGIKPDNISVVIKPITDISIASTKDNKEAVTVVENKPRFEANKLMSGFNAWYLSPLIFIFGYLFIRFSRIKKSIINVNSPIKQFSI